MLARCLAQAGCRREMMCVTQAETLILWRIAALRSWSSSFAARMAARGCCSRGAPAR